MVVLNLAIQNEHDVVAARRRAREIAGLIGFDHQDQIRFATAVSEIVRNAFNHGRGGDAVFSVENTGPGPSLVVQVKDRGPGIDNVGAVLSGGHGPGSGIRLGISRARRLVDGFQMESAAGAGTTVTLWKTIPRHALPVTPTNLQALAERLAASQPHDPFEEVRVQNREMLTALEELQRRQDELSELNRELDETNRGVVALYAELDEKADHLRRADELKSRFLSNMSHEFRTPLNSIIALTRLLINRTDGDLTGEQERQVFYIRRAAESLAELVNDLLDLAKVEAGKTVVRPVSFEVGELCSALRGMLRPLLLNDSVPLVFENCEGLPRMYTDESKIAQILRNFISNALKFTESGEIRVSARLSEDDEEMIFTVSDTGIGIDPADQERIFQDFVQVANPLQGQVKGTGLGLPLSRRLAELLGGSVRLDSTPGVGSTFSASIPRVYRLSPSGQSEEEWQLDASRIPVAVVECALPELVLYENFLKDSAFQFIPARSMEEARLALQRVRPGAILAHSRMLGEQASAFFADLKALPDPQPAVVAIADPEDLHFAGLAGQVDAWTHAPVDREWLLATLTSLTGPSRAARILVIDDDEVFRYLMRQDLRHFASEMLEASSGPDGLDVARRETPDLILLDLKMPGLDGFAALRELKADALTSRIPVIVATSRDLSPEEETLLAPAAAVVRKSSVEAGAVQEAVQRILRVRVPEVA
jgi:signal transduction histidine kinase/CheY-like chemotaxis protein